MSLAVLCIIIGTLASIAGAKKIGVRFIAFGVALAVALPVLERALEGVLAALPYVVVIGAVVGCIYLLASGRSKAVKAPAPERPTMRRRAELVEPRPWPQALPPAAQSVGADEFGLFEEADE
jgi:hypothetical protein